MQILAVLLLSISVCTTHAQNLFAAQDLSLPLLKRCVTCSPIPPLCPPCNPAWDCVQIPQTCDACAHAICVKPEDAATTTAAGSWETPYGQETPASSAESGTTTWSETAWTSTSSTSASEATVSDTPSSSEAASTTVADSVSTPPASPTVATVTTSFGSKSSLADAYRALMLPVLAILAGTLFRTTF